MKTKLYHLIIFSLFIFSMKAQMSTKKENIQIVTKVADKIIAETKWTLTDKESGKTYESSKELAPNPSIVVTSRFNNWFYATLLVMEGMDRLSMQVKQKEYRDFSKKEIAFAAQHVNWFKREWAFEGKKPSGMERFGHYLQFSSLWASGFAPVWISAYYSTKDTVYLDYTTRFKKVVEKCPRDSANLFLASNNVRTDDVYLMAPGMVTIALAEKDAKMLDDALQEVIGSHQLLFDKEKQMYYQSWDVKTKTYTGNFWGRGNGWMSLAFVDLLGRVPKKHPRYEALLGAFREHADGLRRWQDKQGGWRQLIDAETDWIETSCTGMFTYALARGVNKSWLDKSYAVDATLAWKALCLKVTPEGTLKDVCPATHQGTRESYLNRPRKNDDVHGYGPFLLAGAEMIKLSKTK